MAEMGTYKNAAGAKVEALSKSHANSLRARGYHLVAKSTPAKADPPAKSATK